MAKSRAARRIGVSQNANFDLRREIILREAARAYTDSGPDRISMDQLARRLKVTKPAVYHYVSGKDEIISECIAAGLIRLKGIFAHIDENEGTGMHKLEILIRDYARLVTDDFGRCLILLDLGSLKPKSRRQHLQAQQQLRRKFEELVLSAADDGSINPCHAKVLGFAILGAVSSLARWYRPDGEMTLDQITCELCRVLRQGMQPSGADGASR